MPDLPEEDWPTNYFNYFTEVEERFQRARGTGLFLLSPLDWALIDSWRINGVPLEAVLKGIDEAFEKWRSRKQKRRLVNSLAYCAQAVMEAAERTPSSRIAATDRTGDPLFEPSQVATHLTQAAKSLRERPEPSLAEVAGALEQLALQAETHVKDLEQLEQRLTAFEEKIIAILRANQTDEQLFSLRQTLASELKPYRSKMNGDQLATLERRYLDNALLERSGVPRLSLFYLH